MQALPVRRSQDHCPSRQAVLQESLTAVNTKLRWGVTCRYRQGLAKKGLQAGVAYRRMASIFWVGCQALHGSVMLVLTNSCFCQLTYTCMRPRKSDPG